MLDSFLNSKPPEKIYGWLDSQLSIARFYGGLKYQGADYVIDMDDPDHPLVRQDVLVAQKKATKQKKKGKPPVNGKLF